MKIIKDKDIALLLRPFGVKDSNYLAVGALLCFDLLDSRRLYDEQALWRTVQSALGSEGVLDQGMPKIRGEFLVAGNCHVPRNSPQAAAAEVSVRVGELCKTLFVYGERHWTPLGAIARTDGFTRMPVCYANAFGGKGFAKNPGGRGARPVRLPDGRWLQPLPNIEDPAHLVGSREDRPDPAGFGPLDPAWPQRNTASGTYDTRWRRERWPNPPDDFDYGYYNAAPADQQLPDFFNGDELLEIRGMHPDHQSIVSGLPPYRVRCFLTRKTSLWDAGAEEAFVEVPLHGETLWLFPEQLQGVLLCRGAVNVLDDEYADVVRVFLAKEDAADAPQGAEYYAAALQRALDRRVPIDHAPLQKAGEKITAAMKQARNLPKEIERIRAGVLGQSPVMTRTPQEYGGLGARTLAGAQGVLGGLETAAASLRTRFGFLPLNAAPLQTLKQSMEQTGRGLEGVVARLEQRSAEGVRQERQLRARAAEALEALPENIPEEQRERAQALLRPQAGEKNWQKSALAFVAEARRTLENTPEVWQTLRTQGFEDRTIRRARLGLHPHARTLPAADWGLDPATYGEELVLPSGLVLPWFRGKELAGVRIRGRAEEALPGSCAQACLLPGAVAASPVVVAPDILQALFLEQEAGDACHILVLSAPSGTLDEAAARVLKQSAEQAFPLLVLFPEHTRKAALDPWRVRFGNSRALVIPEGKDIFAARAAGHDPRELLLSAVSPEFAARHRLCPEISARGMQNLPAPLQGLEIKKSVDALLEQGKARFAPLKKQLAAESARMLEEASRQITALGLDPDAVFSAAKARPAPRVDVLGAQVGDLLAAQRAELAAQRRLTPDLEAGLLKAEQDVREMAAKAGADLARAKRELEAGKKKLAASEKLAASVAAKLAAKGLDPERLRRLSREEVCQRLRKRQSLAGANLSGLDLSGLNFSRCDLRGADVRKTNFAGAMCDQADLTRVLGQQADFRGARLRDAQLDRAIFTRACFARADLRSARCVRTLFQGADLSGVEAASARFEMAVLQNALLGGADFSRALLHMCVLTGAQAAAVRFDNALLTKSLLKNMLLDGADFGRARVRQTMFWGVRGRRVSFLGADLSKARMGGGCVLHGADFTGATMRQACFRESDLSRALFRGAVLDASLFELCRLVGGDFYRSTAKQCRFPLCDLESADMRAMNLMQGSLRKARLVRTNLGGSNLFGVDFYKAVISGSVFKFSNLKRTLLYGRTELLDDHA